MILTLEYYIEMGFRSSFLEYFNNNIKLNIIFAFLAGVRFLFKYFALICWVYPINKLPSIFLFEKILVELVFELVTLIYRAHDLSLSIETTAEKSFHLFIRNAIDISVPLYQTVPLQAAIVQVRPKQTQCGRDAERC